MELKAVNIYRIVHKDNVEYILRNGMFCREHPSFDPNNIFIGNSTLTADVSLALEPPAVLPAPHAFR